MMKRMILAASVALLAMAAPAAAQQYPPAGASCAADDTTVEVGQTVSVSCSGFDPGSTVEATLFSDPVYLGSATVAGDGTVALSFQVPHVDNGDHHIEIAGDSNGAPVVLSIEILIGDDDGHVVPGRGHVPAHRVLARTGSDTEAMLARAGVGLLAVGGAFILVSRKRRGRIAAASDSPEQVDISH